VKSLGDLANVPPRTKPWPIQHGFDPALGGLVSDEFKAKVEIEIADANERAYMGDGMLKCKWDGCENEVSTHKGLAGYCAKLQSNDKTHRMMFIEKQREADPEYARHRTYRGLPVRRAPSSAAREPASALRPETVSDVQTNGDGFWLPQVKQSVTEALDQVERAEQGLAASKERLREILAQAQEMIR
jgi:hypothetical protein